MIIFPSNRLVYLPVIYHVKCIHIGGFWSVQIKNTKLFLFSLVKILSSSSLILLFFFNLPSYNIICNRPHQLSRELFVYTHARLSICCVYSRSVCVWKCAGSHRFYLYVPKEYFFLDHKRTPHQIQRETPHPVDQTAAIESICAFNNLLSAPSSNIWIKGIPNIYIYAV